ncbi:hypothetical protein [Escherichia coli]|nr:hypothetical protein [Escherichia coli]
MNFGDVGGNQPHKSGPSSRFTLSRLPHPKVHFGYRALSAP